ncbi:MAG: hypothetical protein K2X66_10295 [Cyanobacteria bacterium]|nr:hypothetical protein [Cyanobacteriota bacterium]
MKHKSHPTAGDHNKLYLNLPIEEAIYKLSSALLPPNWPGKGYLGQVNSGKMDGPRFWIRYQSPYFRNGFGPRLQGEFHSEVPSKHPSKKDVQSLTCSLSLKPKFHRAQGWMIVWWLGLFCWTVEGWLEQEQVKFLSPIFPMISPSNSPRLSQTLNPTFDLTGLMGLTILSLGAFVFILWVYGYESRLLRRFIFKTFQQDLSSQSEAGLAAAPLNEFDTITTPQ